MKLLGWMHRKFRQNSNEPVFLIERSCACLAGQPSLDDQQYYPKANYGTKPFKQGQRDHQLRNSFAGLESAKVDQEDYYEDESSAAASELFHGFLAIGTFGSDQVITEPSTPTLPMSVENITEKETEATENELKLINDELEKVLVAEAKDEICNDSSGRNSHVSNGRSSHGSTITLSGKMLEVPESNGINGTTVCPLQGYLFGSAYELSETTTVAKKEQRTSLGELFQKSKLTEENYSGAKLSKEEKRADQKEADKSSIHLMKKKLMKKVLHMNASSRSSAAAADAGSAETKLNKILQMFHRKVHPENSNAGEKSGKYQKGEKKKRMSTDGICNHGDQVLPDDQDIMLYPEQVFSSKQSMRRYKSQSNPPQFALGGLDSNGNKEHWIKTDADYLVLEL
ncbi:protein LAZY 1 isoform X1 [Rosa chinensis]|uniref:protein LAZY 1 isoform X1 n=1 Tax=Rosa chinensis TaxID=74649 RepID=UPI000D096CE3|nr:protein LAZY 1 isoform X1 [Rosa chinensis]